MDEFRYEFDELTGIYNQKMFVKRTEDMLHAAPDKKYILVRSNIFNFKIINEDLI